MNRLVDPAVGFQPGDAVARHPSYGNPIREKEGKLSARHDLAVWLKCDGKNTTSRARIERIGQPAGGIEPGHENCAAVHRYSSVR